MRLLLLLCFSAQLCVAQQAQIIRGPYLQSVTPTSVLVHWRTNVPSASRVFYQAKGKVFEKLDTNRVTDHMLALNQLKPSTRYAYQIDSKLFIVSFSS